MAPEQKELLSLRTLPGRLTVEQAAHVLGFQAHHLPILSANGLIKPLGNPPPNAVKFYAAIEIERLKADTQWLNRASAFLNRHWQAKNRRRISQRTRPAYPVTGPRRACAAEASTD